MGINRWLLGVLLITIHQNYSISPVSLPEVPLVPAMSNFELGIGIDCAKTKNSPQMFLAEVCKRLERISENPITSRKAKPLKQVLQLMSQDQLPRTALYKPQGYLSRLWSHESWEEWTESRTRLGKVVHFYASVADGSTSFKAGMRQLSPQVFLEAIAESDKVLAQHRAEKEESQSCMLNIVLGSVASFSTGHPLPISLAAATCLDVARANNEAALKRVGKHRAQVFERMDQQQAASHGRASVGGGADEGVSDEHIETCKAQLQSELINWTPSASSKLNRLGNGVLSVIMDAWKSIQKLRNANKVIKAVVGLIVGPNEEVKRMLSEYEKSYWLDIIGWDYREIFNEPSREAYIGHGDEATIDFMKKKLQQYGYNPGYGTPLQFLQSLKERGVCERGGRCEKRDL